ncbi:MAG TPA: hypothetical protein VGD27_09510 [Longimicrobiales bacterium]
MSYPLTLRFKVLAIARQLSVQDNSGRLLMYVKQKAFKLREAITVYADEGQAQPLYHIQADRVIDFSARYHITDAAGQELGSVRQRGMRSIWRARYDIFRNDAVVFTVQEENPLAKVGDSFLGEIPILGFFAGYLFHPKYLVSTADGRPVLRATKQPALFEGLFQIDRLETPLTPDDERLLLIGSVTTVLLEKTRG